MNSRTILEGHRKRTAYQLQQLVGDKLRILRLNTGLTQQEVADKCACNRQVIGKIEKGNPGISFGFFFSYLVALNKTSLLDGFNDIIPNPIYSKQHTVKFRQRVKKIN